MKKLLLILALIVSAGTTLPARAEGEGWVPVRNSILTFPPDGGMCIHRTEWAGGAFGGGSFTAPKKIRLNFLPLEGDGGKLMAGYELVSVLSPYLLPGETSVVLDLSSEQGLPENGVKITLFEGTDFYAGDLTVLSIEFFTSLEGWYMFADFSGEVAVQDRSWSAMKSRDR